MANNEEGRKPRFNEEDLGVNPLAADLLILVRTRTFEGQYAYDKQEGIIVPNESNVEQTDFTKVFRSADRRLLYSKLHKSSKELLGWMQYELPVGKDYLWLNRKRFMAENGVRSVNTVKAAIDDLALHGFIAPTIKASVYWINPHHFFCGNRLTKYPQSVLIYNPKSKQNKNEIR